MQNELNVDKCQFSTFLQDLEGRLAMMAGVTDMEDFGLSLEDVRSPMLVIGKPGIGKTMGIMGVIENINKREDIKERGIRFGFKKILLGQTVVGSLSGIPVVQPDGSIAKVQVNDLPDEKKDGKYGVLFLDEITTADEAQVQPALGLCDNSRNIGTYTLPEGWIVVGAGNGPDCSNFQRLDDMTISRFTVYDIAYDFNRDWRIYASDHGINEDIIAFLTFAPDNCVRTESQEGDRSGKQFATPRTWEQLSKMMAMYKVNHKVEKDGKLVPAEVPQDEIAAFSSRILGSNMAREFQAFCAYKKDVNFDPNKIIAGVERPIDLEMRKEVFHILLTRVVTALGKRCDTYMDAEPSSVEKVVPDEKPLDASYPDRLVLEEDTASTKEGTTIKSPYAGHFFPWLVVQEISNALDWFLGIRLVDRDAAYMAMRSLRENNAKVRWIVKSRGFEGVCPALEQFLEDDFQQMMEKQLIAV